MKGLYVPEPIKRQTVSDVAQQQRKDNVGLIVSDGFRTRAFLAEHERTQLFARALHGPFWTLQGPCTPGSSVIWAPFGC